MTRAVRHCMPTLQNLYRTLLEERHGDSSAILLNNTDECYKILSGQGNYTMPIKPFVRV